MDKSNIDKQSEYNSEPVLYCSHCLSLRVMSIPEIKDSDYCDECCRTDINKARIDEWEKLYVQKYGHKYIETY